MRAGPTIFTRLTGLLAVLQLTGCAIPEIPLSTPEPIDVNINVKLDVYQYTREGQKPASEQTEAAISANVDEITAERRQAAEKGMRDRMEEVQTLKNNRVIGENREGLLEIREIPPGEYGQYIETTLLAENADREAVMRALAREEDKPLTTLRREQALLRQKQSFKGEWIEEQQRDGSWRWIRKAEDPR